MSYEFFLWASSMLICTHSIPIHRWNEFKHWKRKMLNWSPAEGLFTPKCARKDVSPTHTPTLPCFGFWIIAGVEGVEEQWRTNIRWGCGWTETNVSCHGMSGCVSSKWCLWATAVLWVTALLTHFWLRKRANTGEGKANRDCCEHAELLYL